MSVFACIAVNVEDGNRRAFPERKSPKPSDGDSRLEAPGTGVLRPIGGFYVPESRPGMWRRGWAVGCVHITDPHLRSAMNSSKRPGRR
jgi:hypothetical protein